LERSLSHPLLTAPIGKSLWKLSAPTTAVMIVQTLVAIAETFIFGRLGTDALAGFALVFPLMMMMTMMAGGGMGGGVAAAMARTLGAGRTGDARALVLHALVLGHGPALLFTLLAWTVAPSLYRLLGGEGASLAKALTYSNVLFTGSLFIWANFILSALLRGGGDAATPGRYMLVTSLAQVPLSYVLALGIGGLAGHGHGRPRCLLAADVRRLGVLQARALWSGKLGFVPAAFGIPLQRRPILGDPAGRPDRLLLRLHGEPDRHAGHRSCRPLRHRGPGRLRHRRAPRIHAGAAGLRRRLRPDDDRGRRRRRQRLAAGGARRLDRQPGRGTGHRRLRLGRGAFPEGWARLFTDDPDVVAATVAYVTRVAPFYFVFGIGMTLSFASQGAGRMKAPFAAGVTRLFVASLGGWFAVEHLGWGLPGVFVAIAVGIVTFGSLIAGPLLVHPWRGRA
jgi:hypothetical protein